MEQSRRAEGEAIRCCAQILSEESWKVYLPQWPFEEIWWGAACPVETGMCIGVLGGAARHRVFLEVLPSTRRSFPEDQSLFLGPGPVVVRVLLQASGRSSRNFP